jgi:hypothetical protein
VTLLLSEIVSFDESPRSRVGDGATRDSTGDSLSAKLPRILTRRSLLQKGTAAGTILGLSFLGLLPPARKAWAACLYNVTEKTIYTSCPTSIAGTCSPGCGPSDVDANACNSNGWHKSTGIWRARPDDCVPGTEYDGWFWLAGGCGCSGDCTAKLRCHDGCKSVSGSWVSTVCKHRVKCICPT